MIGYRWQESLDAQVLSDVEAMLATAAEYDAEAGFSTATPTAAGAGEVRHLLVTIAPPGERGNASLDLLPDVPLVAYLRLDTVENTATAQFVVRPEFRSHGIATLLTELLDEAVDGWSTVPGLAKLVVWAHGAHPAADRMARRFGAAVDHGVFKTLHLLGGSRPFSGEPLPFKDEPASDGPPEVVPGHRLSMAPVDVATLGRGRARLVTDAGSAVVGAEAGEVACLVPEPDEGTALRPLLTEALLYLQDQGARVAQMYVDALDDEFVSVSRALDFHHDQSDLRYVRRL